jgi:hypothetical protein
MFGMLPHLHLIIGKDGGVVVSVSAGLLTVDVDGGDEVSGGCSAINNIIIKVILYI